MQGFVASAVHALQYCWSPRRGFLENVMGLLLIVFRIVIAIVMLYLTSCSKVFPVPAYGPASASASAKAFRCFVVQLAKAHRIQAKGSLRPPHHFSALRTNQKHRTYFCADAHLFLETTSDVLLILLRKPLRLHLHKLGSSHWRQLLGCELRRVVQGDVPGPVLSVLLKLTVQTEPLKGL